MYAFFETTSAPTVDPTTGPTANPTTADPTVDITQISQFEHPYALHADNKLNWADANTFCAETV